MNTRTVTAKDLKVGDTIVRYDSTRSTVSTVINHDRAHGTVFVQFDDDESPADGYKWGIYENSEFTVIDYGDDDVPVPEDEEPETEYYVPTTASVEYTVEWVDATGTPHRVTTDSVVTMIHTVECIKRAPLAYPQSVTTRSAVKGTRRA